VGGAGGFLIVPASQSTQPQGHVVHACAYACLFVIGQQNMLMLFALLWASQYEDLFLLAVVHVVHLC
jgi:hypothetical protein